MTPRRAVLLVLLLAAASVSAWGQLSINPASLPSTPFPVGQVFPAQQLSVPAQFQNDILQWSISAGNLPPGLSLSAVGTPPGSITGTPTQAGAFTFTAMVVDTSGPVPTQATRQYTLYISLGSPLSLSPLTHSPAAAGTSYVGSTFQAGGGVPGYTFALQSGTNSDGLNINANSGQLSGTPLAGGIFPIAVVVTDASGAQASATFSLNVLGISTTSLPSGTVGSSYSQTLAAVGAIGTLSWSVTSTNLPPPGLALSSQGQITGTPTAAGTFPFVVQVTDSATKLSATQALSITVATAISPATLPSGFVNVPYTATTLTVAGVTISNWAVTVGTLPAGLTLNAASGVISGTPTTVGSSTFTISASLAIVVAVVPPVQQQFTLVISAPPSVTISGLPATGVAATQPSASVSLSGGTYPLNLTGTMTLTFLSASGVAQTYDEMFSSSGTTANFTIPTGTTQGLFGTASSVSVLTGTVAGTITVNTRILDSLGNPLPAPAATAITVNSTPPVITKVTLGTVTAGGFSVSVTGYSTPRNMTSALFHFTSPTNTQLAAADVTVPLTSAFTSWYGSAASNAFGSQFTMTVQFSFTGPPGTTVPFTAVTVTLTNSVGTSAVFGPLNP
jgi:large repetitive protein